MIKIAHIITDLSTGGAEMMLYKVLTAMDRSRFDSFVVSMMDLGVIGPKINALGISVYQLGMKAGRPTISSVERLGKLLRSFNPSLIQGWMYHGNLAAIVGKTICKSNQPVIWNIRQSLYNIKKEKSMTRLVIRANKLLSKNVKRIIYNSKISAEQHEAYGFCGSTRIILPNGFDIKKFAPSIEAYQKLRHSLGITKGTIIVGVFARNHPMKDFKNFFHAANIIGLCRPDVHFMLVGRGVTVDNPVFEKLVDGSCVKNNFHLLGERENMYELMGGVDVAVSSSAWGEAFPNALGEAMACGVPCVVTNVGDSAWILGGHGKVVPPMESSALAEGIIELINLDQSKRRELGERARQRIIKEFSIEKVASQYEALYEQVFSENRICT